MKENLIAVVASLAIFASCAGSRQNENILVEVNSKTETNAQTKKNVNQTAASVMPATTETNAKVLSNQNSNVITVAKKSADTPQQRCGWYSNPTPGNHWLDDKDGQWIMGTQGGEQADGDYPNVPDNQWVKTNGNYGYGCACVTATIDTAEKRIIKIYSSSSKPLEVCRKDKSLKEPAE